MGAPTVPDSITKRPLQVPRAGTDRPLTPDSRPDRRSAYLDEPNPAINPALRLLWRSENSLQVGIDPRRAHVIDGLTAADERLLALLDGSRSLPEAAATAGCDPERAASIVAALRRAGAIAPAGGNDLSAVPPRLHPDALAASLARSDERSSDTGAAVVLRRSLRRVDVVGAGRVGATLAVLLAAAGIGTVRCHDDGPARPADVSPGGLPASAGGHRDQAARRQVAAARSQPAAAAVPAQPDLVVLAPVQPVTPPELAAAAIGTPHLEVVIRETTALIGPLVIPGRTTCRRCAELSRADRDPAWPALAAQLATRSRRVDPADLSLAAAAASLAVLHVLRWLDDAWAPSPPGQLPVAPGTAGTAPMPVHPLIGAVAEVCGQTGRVRRRVVHPHPDCGCAATG